MSQIIHVTVKAHPKRPTSIISVSKSGDMVVSIGTLPVMGKANKMLILLLAKHFRVSPSQILLIKGHLSSYKVIEVLGSGTN
jgi:uncharacterized protein YggU (UPF0235/DUF167 family)